jgi:hypothetical protein
MGRNMQRKLLTAFVVLAAQMSVTLVWAQSPSVNFKISFVGQVDCDSPISAKNIPIRGDGTGVLNADGSATADLTQTAFVFTNQVHFDGRLGAAAQSAPGGTSQIRVAGKKSLRLVWNLPNNSLIVSINVRGQSCDARFDAQLNAGKAQYTLFDGQTYHYCGKPRVTQASCEVR